jgi:hypothetical protein
MVKEILEASEQPRDAGTISVAFTLRVITHVADLGNCAIKWPLSRVWALRVCDEAIAQATREQTLGLPVYGKLTPYTEEQLKARQLVFLDGWVRAGAAPCSRGMCIGSQRIMTVTARHMILIAGQTTHARGHVALPKLQESCPCCHGMP